MVCATETTKLEADVKSDRLPLPKLTVVVELIVVVLMADGVVDAMNVTPSTTPMVGVELQAAGSQPLELGAPVQGIGEGGIGGQHR